jgi:hypothetical protein
MLLIANVFSIQIHQPLGRGLQLGTEGLFLTNETERIAKLVSPILTRAMGSLERNCLLETAHAVYYTLTSKAESDSQLVEEFLGHWLQHIRLYFQSLWLIRDNAVRCEIAFAEWHHPTKGPTHSSKFIIASAFKSDGSQDTTEFTLDELKTARSYFSDFLHPLATVESENLEDAIGKPERPKSPFHKGLSRLTRFNYFLSGARSEGEVAVRISLYMTCMEILFSTEPTELTHKLSQRVACFLGETTEERIEIFRTMKRAYGIRSKIVHGGTLPRKLEDDLKQVSTEIDSLIRRIFFKVLSTEELIHRFEQPSEQLEEYFLDLIFQKGV